MRRFNTKDTFCTGPNCPRCQDAWDSHRAYQLKLGAEGLRTAPPLKKAVDK